jgi:regulator of replication initiation timing
MTQQQAPYITDRLFAITGHTADLDEALDEFENVKAAVSELHDENQALTILNRRLRLCLDLARVSLTAMQGEAGMFISDKTRAKAETFIEQYEKLDAARVQSKMITEQG